MTQDTPMTGALATQAVAEREPEADLPYDGPFWIWSKGHSLVAFVAGGTTGQTHGPITAAAFLQLLGAVRATELAERHKRDCDNCKCACERCEVELRDVRERLGAAEPLCHVAVDLVLSAARARRDALQALGVLA